MPGKILVQNRLKRPLVHCITNSVTANDCANLLLACGASAIMAEDPEEAAEITRLCDGLTVNLGTPNPRKMDAIFAAACEANQLGHPVILDPVGVGCSGMRREFAHRLLESIRFAAIRGNRSEIAALACGKAAHRGVDVDIEGENGDLATENARHLAQKTGAVVLVTGESDIVSDGKVCYRVHNGHPLMKTVTGAGCQLSALLGAYMAANPDRPLHAALAAACAMGLCGEIAHARLSALDGNASYRNYIIDAVFHLTAEALEKGAKYEICK